MLSFFQKQNNVFFLRDKYFSTRATKIPHPESCFPHWKSCFPQGKVVFHMGKLFSTLEKLFSTPNGLGVEFWESGKVVFHFGKVVFHTERTRCGIFGKWKSCFPLWKSCFPLWKSCFPHWKSCFPHWKSCFPQGEYKFYKHFYRYFVGYFCHFLILQRFLLKKQYSHATARPSPSQTKANPLRIMGSSSIGAIQQQALRDQWRNATIHYARAHTQQHTYTRYHAVSERRLPGWGLSALLNYSLRRVCWSHTIHRIVMLSRVNLPTSPPRETLRHVNEPNMIPQGALTAAVALHLAPRGPHACEFTPHAGHPSGVCSRVCVCVCRAKK